MVCVCDYRDSFFFSTIFIVSTLTRVTRPRSTPDGKYAFFIRLGWKPVEFEKGKAAIDVPSLDKLPSIIDTLIAAVRNGELDEQLAQAGAQTKPSKGKRAA